MYSANRRWREVANIKIKVQIFITAYIAVCVHAQAEVSATLEQALAFHIDELDTGKIETIFEPRWDIESDGGFRFTAIGRLRFDAEDELGYSTNATHTDGEIRELYLDAEWGGAYWRIGKQQVVWGQADGLRVLDMINPLDYREFILPDFEDRRIPLWMANIDMPLNSQWNVQLLWILDQQYDEPPQPGSTFAFSSPRVVPTLPVGTPVTLLPVDRRPQGRLTDSDAGLRFSAFVNGWDLTFNYLYHYLDQAVAFQRLDDSGLSIEPSYERSHLIGGSFSNAFGAYTVRGELGYSTAKYFLTNNPADADGIARAEEWSYVLGLDYQGWRDWLISAQIFQSIIPDPGPSLFRHNVDTSATLLVRRNFMNDSLRAEALVIRNLNDDDGMLQMSVEYEWRANILIKFGVDVFSGSHFGLFGQFDNNDRITMGLEIGI
jgi:hypothetical protein